MTSDGTDTLTNDTEVFLIFSQPIPSSNLGFISSSDSTITVTVGDDDYEVHQSPGLLSSNASGGTTGAVLWKITPLVATWLQRSDNFLFSKGILSSDSHVVELGCGISGLIALTLSKRISRYVATDLDYVLKGLRKNLAENGVTAPDQLEPTRKKSSKPARHSNQGKSKQNKSASSKKGEISTSHLDWTECTPQYLSEHVIPGGEALDCILACDCIYNEALVEPFVQTCVDLCKLRDQPPVCVIAQQLRSDLVLEAWLEAFIQHFHVYRVPDDLIDATLRSGTGYVVHVGILRATKS